MIEKHLPLLQPGKNPTLLDIGCGTGAFCYYMTGYGFQTTGLDTSKNMLKYARRKNRGNSSNFVEGNILKGLPYADNSFDYVFTCFVAHGINSKQRETLYREALRVAGKMFIMHDYNTGRKLFTDIIEWAERGDYFNFIKNVDREVKSIREDVKIIPTNEQTAWYIFKK